MRRSSARRARMAPAIARIAGITAVAVMARRRLVGRVDDNAGRQGTQGDPLPRRGRMPIAAGVLGNPGGVGGDGVGRHGQAFQKGRISRAARQSEGGSGDANDWKIPNATDDTPPRKDPDRNNDMATLGYST